MNFPPLCFCRSFRLAKNEYRPMKKQLSRKLRLPQTTACKFHDGIHNPVILWGCGSPSNVKRRLGVPVGTGKVALQQNFAQRNSGVSMGAGSGPVQAHCSQAEKPASSALT